VQTIVVDDASTDNSRDIIARYGDRVVPVLLARNAGQGAAFNAGFRASAGNVVIFLDADDWLSPCAAERVVAAMLPDVAQVQFRLHLVGADGRRIDLIPAPEIRFDTGNVVPLLLSRGRYESTVTSGNAFARSVLDAILPIPEEKFRISADGYLVTLAPLYGRLVSIDAPLGAYVMHGSNLWAGSAGHAGLSAKFRRELSHDECRYEALRSKAGELGMPVDSHLGLADPRHLTSRLGSLLTDPRNHPYPGDARASLGLRGAWASRDANLIHVRRALQVTWFLLVGLLPGAAASKMLQWRIDPGSRPQRLRQTLATVRRWMTRSRIAGSA
ncbi:MAG: glycosyltransferase, partial [Hyphomicrobiaceae bacterium]|nr:glycosyltransferase [Hyphomicrobiaceae bacterium]